mmetsp:Transcript_116761/g.203110  ORF Transcript_116761/g.203110 Transcript_116761/m.203110 type:complete len:87 (-) Transcript_116761:66-326(-)
MRRRNLKRLWELVLEDWLLYGPVLGVFALLPPPTPQSMISGSVVVSRVASLLEQNLQSCCTKRFSSLAHVISNCVVVVLVPPQLSP